MSDGPYRSLNMNRSWKRLAEYADNGAYSVDEVAGAFLPALEQSWREEVPDEVWRPLKQIFGDQQRTLFGDKKAEEIGALRFLVTGQPLGCSLVDIASKAASNGAHGPDALVEITKQALLQRAARGNKQVEEHWYRKSTEKRTENVRDRLEHALNKAALDTLARQRLDMSTDQKALRTKKQTDLDDGVQL